MGNYLNLFNINCIITILYWIIFINQRVARESFSDLTGAERNGMYANFTPPIHRTAGVLKYACECHKYGRLLTAPRVSKEGTNIFLYFNASSLNSFNTTIYIASNYRGAEILVSFRLLTSHTLHNIIFLTISIKPSLPTCTTATSSQCYIKIFPLMPKDIAGHMITPGHGCDREGVHVRDGWIWWGQIWYNWVNQKKITKTGKV